MGTKSLARAVSDLRQGRMVILIDDEQRENEGDIVMAAEHVTPEAINFMITYARGLVCLPMAGAWLDRLKIPLMVSRNTSRFQCAFTVSIDAATGITTGTSAADRARTARLAADPNAKVEDFVMPGHMFPLRSHPGGVAMRRGHTEGSLALLEHAGCHPVAVICEIMNSDGSMARMQALSAFAEQHSLALITMRDILQ